MLVVIRLCVIMLPMREDAAPLCVERLSTKEGGAFMVKAVDKKYCTRGYDEY